MGLPTVARAAETSGTTGDVNWSYADGVLTLSGTGVTATDYAKDGQPWQSYMTKITKVVVEEGVTVLGKNLFYGASALTDVTIPKGCLLYTSIPTFERKRYPNVSIHRRLRRKYGLFLHAVENFPPVSLGIIRQVGHGPRAGTGQERPGEIVGIDRICAAGAGEC